MRPLLEVPRSEERKVVASGVRDGRGTTQALAVVGSCFPRELGGIMKIIDFIENSAMQDRKTEEGTVRTDSQGDRESARDGP